MEKRSSKKLRSIRKKLSTSLLMILSLQSLKSKSKNLPKLKHHLHLHQLLNQSLNPLLKQRFLSPRKLKKHLKSLLNKSQLLFLKNLQKKHPSHQMKVQNKLKKRRKETNQEEIIVKDPTNKKGHTRVKKEKDLKVKGEITEIANSINPSTKKKLKKDRKEVQVHHLIHHSKFVSSRKTRSKSWKMKDSQWLESQSQKQKTQKREKTSMSTNMARNTTTTVVQQTID